MPRLVTLALLAALVATPAAGQARQPPAQTPNLSTIPPVIPSKVYIVEQVVTARQLPPELIKQMEPLKTLRQVEELLKANSIPYGWRKAEMNTATFSPSVLQLIEKLPPGEVFVIPAGENLTMNVIIGRR